MADHSNLILQFRDVTGVEDERARFYLESSGWQLDIALASFYENDGIDQHTNDEVIDDEPVIIPAENPQQASDEREIKPKVTASRKKPEFSSSDSDDSDEDGQAFYVGGSETSGQQVLGPRRQRGANDLVGDMFKSAREHGAEVVEPGSSGHKKKQAFKGTGYRLGQSEVDTQVVAGAREPDPPRNVTLKLWKNGFSINEGPCRDYSNPENKEFLDYIKRGEIPQELLRETPGREIHLQMEDHRTEEFLSKKSRFQAFGGQGQMLGSPAPNLATPSPGTAVSAETVASNEQKAILQLNLAENEPITSVQIRLADGSRLIGRFNHTHTVGQLRQYVIVARPQYANQTFALMTTYPPKELNDNSVTLKDAGLLNATIMQRIK